MSSFIKFALLLGAASLALASVIPCAHQISLEAVASGIVSPSGFWQISQKDTNLSINLFPFAPNGSAVFAVSQDAGATNKLDLIASFTGFPPGKGPYSIEFWYSRSGGYSFSGSNDNIEVFAIKGPLPTQDVGGTVKPVPTWANVQQLTGSQIGFFHLPRKDENPDQSKKIFINQPSYQSTFNLRFSLTSSNSKEGSVRYTQNADPGSSVPGLTIVYG